MAIESLAMAPVAGSLARPDASEGFLPAAEGPIRESSRPDFLDFIGREVSAVNHKIQVADESVRKLALGEAENLHQVMISLEKAKLSFEMVVQVRNKLLEGYQEVMRMQV